MYCLNLLATYIKLQNLICSYLSLLYESLAGHHYKEFPLGIVPVFSLRYAGLAYIYRELTTGGGLKKLRKAAPVVRIHLKRKAYLFFW